MSAVRVLDPGNEDWRENEWSPRFVKHKQLRSSAKSTQNKKKLDAPRSVNSGLLGSCIVKLLCF